MKVGIVTHILYHNYGGTLQAYALQEVLRRMGHNPITIDYLPDYISKTRYVAAQVKTTLNYLFLRTNRKYFSYPHRLRCPQFANFMDNYMQLTTRVKSYKPSIIRKYGMEALVVGSDQVWRGAFNPVKLQADMYLRFAKDFNFPKVAYAASFGIDTWEYSEELTKECSRYAKMLTAVSTREDSGVKLCKDFLGVDAIGVSDPTLLLEKTDYDKLCAHIPVHKEPFLLAYLLDMTPELERKVNELAFRLHLPVKFYTSENQVELSVEEWLAMYRDASFVVTNSFHGTVFSIINNKDFYSIVHENRGADRFNSLLNRFHLKDRLIKYDVDFPSLSSIDWSEVNKLREMWKNNGIQYLDNSLKGNYK